MVKRQRKMQTQGGDDPPINIWIDWGLEYFKPGVLPQSKEELVTYARAHYRRLGLDLEKVLAKIAAG